MFFKEIFRRSPFATKWDSRLLSSLFIFTWIENSIGSMLENSNETQLWWSWDVPQLFSITSYIHVYIYIYIQNVWDTTPQHGHTRQTPTQPINQVNQPINQPTNQPNNKLTKQPNNHKQTHQSTHSHFSSPQTFSLSTWAQMTIAVEFSGTTCSKQSDAQKSNRSLRVPPQYHVYPPRNSRP